MGVPSPDIFEFDWDWIESMGQAPRSSSISPGARVARLNMDMRQWLATQTGLGPEEIKELAEIIQHWETQDADLLAQIRPLMLDNPQKVKNWAKLLRQIGTPNSAALDTLSAPQLYTIVEEDSDEAESKEEIGLLSLDQTPIPVPGADFYKTALEKLSNDMESAAEAHYF
jgi:hypothetical protein